MAPPGRLEARYERLAGAEAKRRELYIVRRRLRFTVDEWQALPWWQKRLYIEGLEWEAEQNRAPTESDGMGAADPAEAILNGTLGDVTAALGG